MVYPRRAPPWTRHGRAFGSYAAPLGEALLVLGGGSARAEGALMNRFDSRTREPPSIKILTDYTYGRESRGGIVLSNEV